MVGGDKKDSDLPWDSPIVHGLGEPAKDRVPVRQVGFLLGHILLTVAQHLGEQTHKPIRLLLQHAGAEGAQVQEVAYKERRLSARARAGTLCHFSAPPSACGSSRYVYVQEEIPRREAPVSAISVEQG